VGRSQKQKHASAAILHVLGVETILGRLIRSGGDQPGCGALQQTISYACLAARFCRRFLVVGTRLTLDGIHLVIGVTPPGFMAFPLADHMTCCGPSASSPIIAPQQPSYATSGLVWPYRQLETRMDHARANAQMLASHSCHLKKRFAVYDRRRHEEYLEYKTRSVFGEHPDFQNCARIPRRPCGC